MSRSLQMRKLRFLGVPCLLLTAKTCHLAHSFTLSLTLDVRRRFKSSSAEALRLTRQYLVIEVAWRNLQIDIVVGELRTARHKFLRLIDGSSP